jgi:hypothetical protein
LPHLGGMELPTLISKTSASGKYSLPHNWLMYEKKSITVSQTQERQVRHSIDNCALLSHSRRLPFSFRISFVS